MKHNYTTGFLLLVLWLVFSSGRAQTVNGYWLGVTYPNDPTQLVYNYTMSLTQTGTTLGGTAQTANPNVPFGGVATISGRVNGNTVTFGESDQNGSTTVKDICFWRGTLTYNPTDESLIGTYENITNGTTCTQATTGKVELYRIVLKSGNRYCKGSPVNLVVTGKNIRWYASASRTNVLATGNTYSPKITQTTTFYITQTLYKTESPAVPITVEVSTPTFSAIPVNTSCDKTNNAIQVTTADSTGWQYSLNGGAFKRSPVFNNLGPGSYTVVAKDAAGCQGEQVVAITPEAGPTISQLISTPPRCESANGSISVVATGGKAPLTYSIDYGKTFQSSPTFNQLPGGSYTLRAHDVNGCETNRAVNLPAAKPVVILTTDVISTSCGQVSGQLTITSSGDTRPFQYSIDSQSFQPGNTFSGLSAGGYTVVVRDSAGCTASQSVRVAASTGPQPVAVQLTPEGCGEKNGAVTIAPPNAAAVMEYALDGQTFQRALTFRDLRGGTYTLTLRDAKNCLGTQVIQLPNDCPTLVHLPTAFSPNADQVNDALTVYFRFPTITVLQFTVFDRWGTVLYNRLNFALSNGEPVWDGQIDGQMAPAGMYTYRLDCQFPDGTQTSYRQAVALLH